MCNQVLTYRLPSFSELILSFKGQPNEISTAKDMYASTTSALPSIISNPYAYQGNQSNFQYPIRDEAYIKRGQSLSYNFSDKQSKDDNDPHQSPNTHKSPKSTETGLYINRPKHLKSTSLPDIYNTNGSENSSQKNEEENLLSSLSRMLDNSFHSIEIDAIKAHYLALVDQAPEVIPDGVNVLQGYVNSGHSKYITQDSFNKFILSISMESIDSIILNYEENLNTLRNFRNMNKRLKEENRLRPKFPSLPISPNSEKYSQYSSHPLSRTVSGSRQPVKRRKSSVSIISRTSTSTSAKHSIGGSIIPLDIKMPQLISTSSASTQDLGTLNSDLSMRQEISCSHCGSKDTPEWRKGIDGGRTLCNACGLFFSKLTKRYNAVEAAKIMKERKENGSVHNRRIK